MSGVPSVARFAILSGDDSVGVTTDSIFKRVGHVNVAGDPQGTGIGVFLEYRARRAILMSLNTIVVTINALLCGTRV
jgi:hypothetical protein